MTKRKISDLDGDGGQATVRTYVCFILDESGSMDACKAQVLSGYREYLQGLRKQPDLFFSLTKFNTVCLPVLVAVPVASVPDLTEQTYVPGGNTALYDSVQATVGLLEAGLPADGGYRVLVVIMTDGEENSSQHATKAQIAELIAAQEALGNWTFVYLGAGRDAWAEAAMMGVAAGNTMAYRVAHTVGTFTGLAQATACYAKGSATGTRAFYQDAGQTADLYVSSSGDAQRIMDEFGWSLEAVAGRIGVDAEQVRQWTRGAIPHPEQIQKLKALWEALDDQPEACAGS